MDLLRKSSVSQTVEYLTYAKMRLLLILVLILAVTNETNAAQCSPGVSSTYTLVSEAYTYSAITNLVNVNAYPCSDNTCAYTVANGLVTAVDYTMISKLDAQFIKTWEKALIGQVKQEAFQMSNDEQYMIFAPNNLVSCTLIKLNTSDGSFNQQKLLALISQ